LLIHYAYDAEGIAGFSTGGTDDYYFVKDAMGNVRALVQSRYERQSGAEWSYARVVARYEYDAWGVCRVLDGDGRDLTDLNHIGHINPIRFKSMYYDAESKMYLVGGNRYYSPEARQYISGVEAEGALGSAGVIYGLNPYALCLTNPVGLVYAGYTILPNADLAFDPPVMTFLQRFFGSLWGRLAAVVVAIVAKLLLPGVGFAISAALIGAAIGAQAILAGYRSWSRGGGFWSGVADYVVGNWAMSVALGFALALGVVGVKKAVVAVKGAGSKVPVASSVLAQEPLLTKSEIKKLRQKAVAEAWQNEIANVQAGGDGSGIWTEKQLNTLRSGKKVKGMHGHHMKSVKGYPQLAGDAANVQFLTPEQHLEAHFGNWQNITHGRFM